MAREMEKYLVEFLGTTFFLYVIISTGNALAIGAALAIAILVGGSISGGNFNPAVSVMMMMAGKLKTKDGVCYIIAQLLGAMLAFALYKHVKF
jgi:aquaporin Z